MTELWGLTILSHEAVSHVRHCFHKVSQEDERRLETLHVEQITQLNRKKKMQQYYIHNNVQKISERTENKHIKNFTFSEYYDTNIAVHKHITILTSRYLKPS